MKRYRAWCTCSWHGTYDTEPIAKNALRQHSCERWTAHREARRRRVAGRAPKDRTATGHASLVPATRARQHVLKLLEVLTTAQIEERSGVNRTAIRVLLGQAPGRGPSKRVRRTTEAALLAVAADRVGTEAHGLVNPAGTRRRVQALVALGYPMMYLAARLRMGSSTLWALTSPSRQDSSILVSTRDAVRRLYDELSLTTPAPSRTVSIARNLAASRGWPVPLAWDDDEIDDPAAAPHLPDAEPDPTADERLDEWLFLVRGGEEQTRAAHRVGYRSISSIESVAARLHRRDVQDTVRSARGTYRPTLRTAA